MKIGSFILVGVLALLLFPVPTVAQTLTNGDFALCEVRGRDGRFIGYDSVCLESRRAALRELQHRRGRSPQRRAPYPVAAVYYCPTWANNGYGYTSTMRFNGGVSTSFGTFDSQVNGNFCVPRPVYVLPGWR